MVVPCVHPGSVTASSSARPAACKLVQAAVEAWARVEAGTAAWGPYRDASLDRWQRRAALAGGGGSAGRNLKALAQPLSAQVAAALATPARMRARSQLPRWGLLRDAASSTSSWNRISTPETLEHERRWRPWPHRARSQLPRWDHHWHGNHLVDGLKSQLETWKLSSWRHPPASARARSCPGATRLIRGEILITLKMNLKSLGPAPENPQV